MIRLELEGECSDLCYPFFFLFELFVFGHFLFLFSVYPAAHPCRLTLVFAMWAVEPCL